MSTPRPLHVTADLELDLDGIPARVTGDGTHLHVVLDRVPGRRLPVPRALAAGAADALAAAGVTVSVETPQRAVATFGAGVRSPVGRLVAGSERVRIAAPELPRSARATALAVAALVLVGAATAWRARARPR